MAAAAVLLVLLAPFAGREPIGQAGWEHERTESVSRRVAGLMAGPAWRMGSVSVVPLFARVPSEAGHGPSGSKAPVLATAATGQLVVEGARRYLRITNPTGREMLLLAGTAFTTGGQEAYLLRDAVVPPRFSALLPVRTRHVGAGARMSAQLPPLPAAATGAMNKASSDADRALGHMTGGGAYRDLLRRREVVLKRDLLRKKVLRRFEEWFEGTVVGAVFLVGNRVAGAHVFRTHELFMAAAPGLLWSTAVHAHVEEQMARTGRDLKRLAETGDARGRAVAFLRNMLDAPVARSESYGVGFDVTITNERDRVIGLAVVDHRHETLHIGYYAVRDYWPRRARGGNGRGGTARPPPSRPPDSGKSEDSPGVVDRRPRPSIGAKRVRDRKPQRPK